MILAQGKLYDTAEQERILAGLGAEIARTRMEKTLDTEIVVAALDKLGQLAEAGAFDARLAALELDNSDALVKTAASLLRRESVACKLRVELGADYFRESLTEPPPGRQPLRVRALPLGTLFHIAAGNIDGLPAVSVAEGLLTGNVNILKLPQADDGVSIEILQRLLELEPRLSDFLYVFDTPSSDVAAMQKMAALADGVVVWGGDEAIRAVRRLAPPGAKLIEWGHRLGFAYIAGTPDDAELDALAAHILSTKQLLCSSCQTIFLDTDDIAAVHGFCARFLPFLEAAARRWPAAGIAAAAELTLRRYYNRLERALSREQADARRVFQGEACSLTACPDSALELSEMFGSCLVKPLPRQALPLRLRQHKDYLQTAGLICPEQERPALCDLLARSGVTRITRAGNMSASFCAEAHDGEYPLRRYTRIVNIEP